MFQYVRRIVGARPASSNVGALPTLRVTSFPVVRRVRTVVGRAATVTSTLTSVLNVLTSAVIKASVSTLTALTPAGAKTGTSA